MASNELTEPELSLLLHPPEDAPSQPGPLPSDESVSAPAPSGLLPASWCALCHLGKLEAVALYTELPAAVAKDPERWVSLSLMQDAHKSALPRPFHEQAGGPFKVSSHYDRALLTMTNPGRGKGNPGRGKGNQVLTTIRSCH